MTTENNVPFGEFPFPLTEGKQESSHLMWLRNHSNYMVVRGFLDYLRSAGVLVRGIIVNFLIFLPCLLLIAIGLAVLHHWMLENPYILTLWVMAISMVTILVFTIALPLYAIAFHKKSLETGSTSSLRLRDGYERLFSILLLAILGAALLESVPRLLEYLLDLNQTGRLGWQASLASVAVGLAAFSGADKLLSTLRGVKKKLATVLVGLIGLLVPLLAVLYAVNFLLYGAPVTPWLMVSPLIVAGSYFVLILFAIGVALRRKALSGKKEVFAAGGLQVLALLAMGVVLLITVAKTRAVHPHDTPLNKIVAPMQLVASYFNNISNKQALAPDVAAFVDQVTKAERDTIKTRDDIRDGVEIDCFNDRYATDHWQQWNCEQKIADWERKGHAAAKRYLELGDKLSAITDTNMDPLRAEIAKIARAKLWSLLKTHQDEKDCGYYASCKDEDVVQRARRILIFRQLSSLPLAEIKSMTKSVPRDASVCDAFDEDASPAAAKVCARFEAAYTPETQYFAIEAAIGKAQSRLAQIPNEELAELISESDLFKELQEKLKSANLYGQAEIARLAGKEAMARLLTKHELLCSIFYARRTCTFVLEDGEAALKTLPGPSMPGDKKGNDAAKTPERRIAFRADFNRATKWAFLQAVLPANPVVSDDTQGAAAAQQGMNRLRKMQTEPDMPALAKLAAWKPTPPPGSKEAKEAQYRWDSPWKRPNDDDLSNWSKDTHLNPEYLARVAGEHLLGNVLRDLTVGHLESILKLLSVEWRYLQYDPSRKATKDAVESLYVISPNSEPWSAKPLERVVGDVQEMKKNVRKQKTAFTTDRLNTDVDMVLELARRVHIHPMRLKEQIRGELIRQALQINNRSSTENHANAQLALRHMDNFHLRLIVARRGNFLELRPYSEELTSGALVNLAITKLESRTPGDIDAIDKLITAVVLGEHGGLERPDEGLKKQLTLSTIRNKIIFIGLLAFVIGLGCWLVVDVNLTSIHGLYRDRLASAFLVGLDAKGDNNRENGVELSDICRYEARSVAPYHLINVALNLQDSRDIGVRDRNSDFFIFSKRFIGGERTGYCRSETMEQVFPQVDLATAMAISAAAASPNMGRGTSPLLVAFMTMLNIRLGFWLPNPGRLEEELNRRWWQQRSARPQPAKPHLGFTFEEVYAQELKEIVSRWEQVYPDGSMRRRLDAMTEARLKTDITMSPTVDHRLVGIAFSGGGIRSAAINLGISQALHHCGVFAHVDYMSTVSGGGYLGSSISALMHAREKLVSVIPGQVTLRAAEGLSTCRGTITSINDKQVRSDLAGTVTISVPRPDTGQTEQDSYARGNRVVVVKGSGGEKSYSFPGHPVVLAVPNGAKVEQNQLLFQYCDVVITPSEAGAAPKTHRCSSREALAVKPGDTVEKGQRLFKYVDVVITPSDAARNVTAQRHQFTPDAQLGVDDNQPVYADMPLLKHWSNRGQSEIAGKVTVTTTEAGEQIVTIPGSDPDQPRVYRFSRFDKVIVKTDDVVKQGQALIQRHDTVVERFLWRVQPFAFLREMLSKLDETHPWVNLSDGGHIENLAAIELLRRRCKYIIIGDGEADPEMHFNGLATLMRCAEIDLGVKIDIHLDRIRLTQSESDDSGCRDSLEHWTLGTICYPEKNAAGEHDTGYLLYLKSSFTGDEDEVIREYRHRNPTFPHESTADQFFDEGQFEAYRALGQHIAEKALTLNADDDKAKLPAPMTFDALEQWFQDLGKIDHSGTKTIADRGRN
jgi:hypothetical protein